MPIRLPEIEELTVVQIQILYSNDKPLIVAGGPGTGKTVLAIHLIKNISKQYNGKINFIVFNRTLQMEIKEFFNNNSNIDIRTCNSWIFVELRNFYLYYRKLSVPTHLTSEESYEYICDIIEKDFQINSYKYDWQKVYAAFEEMYGDTKPYMHFFIDEAQDLDRELLELIKKYSENTYIFFDDKQKITEGGCTNILDVFNCEESFYDLTVNYRNTKKIQQILNLFYSDLENSEQTLPTVNANKEGNKPKLYDIKNNIKLLVNIVVDEFTKNQFQSIGVLLPLLSSDFKTVFSKYKEQFEIELKKYNLLSKFKCYFGDEKTNYKQTKESGIYLLTYNTTKGLEYDTVFLVELNNPMLRYDKEEDRKAFYVAASRARYNLNFVFNSEYDQNEIIKKLLSNQHLIDTMQIRVDQKL